MGILVAIVRNVRRLQIIFFASIFWRTIGIIGRIIVFLGGFVGCLRATPGRFFPAARTPPLAGLVFIGVERILLLDDFSLLGSFLFKKRLPVSRRDLIVVGMDFAKGQKAVAVAAIVHKRRLQRRFDPGYLCQIDVSAKLFLRL